ncbi:MAG: hypothetical protein OEY89_12865, partial [Gammaproteobacteria bacterium]|nr:hypothetical protein [Gammaproteobacteria bacterium]
MKVIEADQNSNVSAKLHNILTFPGTPMESLPASSEVSEFSQKPIIQRVPHHSVPSGLRNALVPAYAVRPILLIMNEFNYLFGRNVKKGSCQQLYIVQGHVVRCTHPQGEFLLNINYKEMVM